jgi:hypothetical protein
MLFFFILLYIQGNVSFCVRLKAKMEACALYFFLDKGNGALYLLNFFPSSSGRVSPHFQSINQKNTMMIMSCTSGPP